jgi:phospholipase/lecithinase/hemolysin
MDPHDVVSNIADAVQTLYQLGARDVIVLNLPDLGLVPANAGDPGPASALSAFHNALLANAMTALASHLPKLNLIQADFAQAFLQLPAGMNQVVPALETLFLPGTFPSPPYPPGFHISACLFIDPVTCADAPTFNVGNAFLFWDIVHPTTAAHRVLGDYLFQLLVQ